MRNIPGVISVLIGGFFVSGILSFSLYNSVLYPIVVKGDVPEYLVLGFAIILAVVQLFIGRGKWSKLIGAIGILLILFYYGLVFLAFVLGICIGGWCVL